MILHFVFIGKKNSLYQPIEQLYLTRLRKWFDVQIIYLPDRFSAKSNDSTTVKNLAQKYDSIWICDEKGRSGSSLDWKCWVNTIYESQLKRWCICIGGAYGFTDADRHYAQSLMSLAPFTLPHHLARITLMEQIYRSMTLISNHPYHKEN